MSYSIKLLTDHKQELEHDLQKSLDSYRNNPNYLQVHSEHKRNLQPKIDDLTANINKLK